MYLRNLRAKAWTTHAATTVIFDDPTKLVGTRVIAECDSEEAARLFAAAPDLLDALRAVVTISDRKHDVWDKAHAAIAKATKGEP